MKTDKKALLAYAEQIPMNDYPDKKIILIFTLLGGGVGGLLIGLGMDISFLIEWIQTGKSSFFLGADNSLEFLIASLAFLLLTFIFGTVIGVLPACICACIIVRHEMTLATPLIHLKLFLIGSSIIILPALLMGIGIFVVGFVMYLFDKVIGFTPFDIFISIFGNGFENLMIASCGFVGGLTAVILGRFTLPKN